MEITLLSKEPSIRHGFQQEEHLPANLQNRIFRHPSTTVCLYIQAAIIMYTLPRGPGREEGEEQGEGEQVDGPEILAIEVQHLTDDCLVVIFNFLPIVDRINIETVCSRWRRLARDSWWIHKCLDMDVRRWGIFPRNRAHTTPRITNSLLDLVVARCGPFLESLRLSQETCRGDLGPADRPLDCRDHHQLDAASNLCFESILSRCPKLQNLSISLCCCEFPAARDQRVSHDERLQGIISGIALGIPRGTLKHLALNFLTKLFCNGNDPVETSRYLDRELSLIFNANRRTLRTVQLAGIPLKGECLLDLLVTGDPATGQVACPVGLLERLAIADCELSDPDSIAPFLAALTNLKALYWDNRYCDLNGPFVARALLSCCVLTCQLTEMNLHYGSDDSEWDASLPTLLRRSHGTLEALSLHDATLEMKQLFQSLLGTERLRELELHSCRFHGMECDEFLKYLTVFRASLRNLKLVRCLFYRDPDGDVTTVEGAQAELPKPDATLIWSTTGLTSLRLEVTRDHELASALYHPVRPSISNLYSMEGLEFLDLSHPDVNDDFLQRLSRQLITLRYFKLTLDSCPLVTDSGIGHCTSLPLLEQFVLIIDVDEHDDAIKGDRFQDMLRLKSFTTNASIECKILVNIIKTSLKLEYLEAWYGSLGEYNYIVNNAILLTKSRAHLFNLRLLSYSGAEPPSGHGDYQGTSRNLRIFSYDL